MGWLREDPEFRAYSLELARQEYAGRDPETDLRGAGVDYQRIRCRGRRVRASDEVELDVIIKDGRLLICELRSWIDKAGMYMFERKARFYERRHQRQADRLIVVSPRTDAGAQQVAERLGIETYADSLEVATG